jgi:hypothetical protein
MFEQAEYCAPLRPEDAGCPRRGVFMKINMEPIVVKEGEIIKLGEINPKKVRNMPDNSLREKLAELEHKQWSHWYRYMVGNLTPENKERWDAQAATPYALLTEPEKNSDRVWADKVLEILKSERDETDSINTK